MNNFNIYGGTVNFGTFNQRTYDFAKTKELGSNVEEFEGNVASLNGNTINGRFWLDDEERTVSFNQDRLSKLTDNERQILSWSLNEYVNQREGKVVLVGTPLRSKQGMLKAIFVTSVRRV